MPDQYKSRYSTFSSKPRKAMRRMSDKRARQLDDYDDAVAQVMARDRSQCRVQVSVPHVRCSGRIDPHHVILRSRAPKLWTDPDNMIAVCRAHHDWIHGN